MIDEKLMTGYHGVKHLFSSNDVNKLGRLTKFFIFSLEYGKIQFASCTLKF